MSVIVDDFVVIDTVSTHSECVINDEDTDVGGSKHCNNKKTYKHDDNNSIAGWSEISAPSVRSMQSSLVERSSSSPRNKKLLSDNTLFQSPCRSHEEISRNVTSNIPFSWAEITKIQPSYHKTVSINKLDIQNALEKSNNSINKKGKNENSDDDENKNTECVDDKLPKISEEDCHATKEDFGRTAKRAGKKGSRIKYPNGKKSSRRNNRK